MIGMLNRYLTRDEATQHAVVNEAPGPAFPGSMRYAALLLAALADHVFQEFGVAICPSIADLVEALTLLPKSDY